MGYVYAGSVAGRAPREEFITVLQKDQLLTLGQAARTLPGVVSPGSLWRWCRIGIKGIALDFTRIGGRVYVTEAALTEFLRATTEADKLRFQAKTEAAAAARTAAKAGPSPSRRKKRAARAMERLAAAGC